MIQDRDFNQLMNLARIKLPGASETALRAELFDVLTEFVGDSNCWNEQIALTIEPTTQAYTLTPQAGGQIIRLVGVWDANLIGYPALIVQMDGPPMPGLASIAVADPPSATVWFVWPQNQPISATAQVIKNVVLPNQKGEIPDGPSWLFPRFHTYILDGLLGRMMTQPKKSYSDAQMGPYHLKRFRTGIAMAKTAALRSYIFGGQSWRFPRQNWTTSQRGGVSTPFPSTSGWG